MTPIQIIPALPAHRALMLDAFWREYQQNSPQARGVPPKVLTAKLETLLDAPGWTTLVATPPDDWDSVLGFLVYKNATTVGWLHALSFGGFGRRKGVAGALIERAGIVRGVISCAFLPPEFAKRASQYGWTLRFRPYLPDVEREEAVQAAAKAMVVE